MKNIIVPEGMLKAAIEALSVEQDVFQKWMRGEPVEYDPGSRGYPLLLMLRAALRWLSDNPIIPDTQTALNLRQIGIEISDQYGTIAHTTASVTAIVTEWQRCMFLAPDPDASSTYIRVWEALAGITPSHDEMDKIWDIISHSAHGWVPPPMRDAGKASIPNEGIEGLLSSAGLYSSEKVIQVVREAYRRGKEEGAK